MANVSVLIILVTLAAIFQQVSVVLAEPKLCTPLGHPDWDCNSPLVCEKDWPSETGNYGSRDLNTKIKQRSESQGRILFLDSEVNSTTVKNDIHRRRLATMLAAQNSQNHSIVSRSATSVFPEQCCRLTVECFDFIEKEIPNHRRDYNGRLLIEDFSLWKKAECCMSDFVTPKSWCLTPPPRNSWFSWHAPPECAEFH
ncbi:hypothetical protein AYO20_05306 [Fonsecaea nubica]|uniref:Uncharacterized protein n=1 Tax=Fonsecaea nubica TaxID=856822 RepID=A0A178D151_9EURO|nr:hypothetical protein AYO20_05306 [Fonsecaea nubica]OAL35456.1 hypothetical protein AYO20_05306 [Fonsecaea nubica]